MTWKIVRALFGRSQPHETSEFAPSASAAPHEPNGPHVASVVSDVTPAPQVVPAPASAHDQAKREGDTTPLRGIGVSPGSAVGPALIYRGAGDLRPKGQSDARSGAPADAPADAPLATETKRAESRARLLTALAAARVELSALAEHVRRDVGSAEGEIFEAQALMLDDPTLLTRIEELLASGRMSAPDALRAATEEQAEILESLPDPLWQARADDVRDAARRALTLLAGTAGTAGQTPSLAQRLEALDASVVLIADDLSPSDTALLRRDRVAGIALARGSATSHAAILARALGIPAIAGLGARLLSEASEGAVVALDSASGCLALNPRGAQERAARDAAARWSDLAAVSRGRAARWRTRPGALRDGAPVPLLANVGSRDDALRAAEHGAEGIGLMRTEFVFAQAAESPDAEEQAATYLDIIAALGAHPGPIIIRTLDAGADKPLLSLRAYTHGDPNEANPALGVRGIRLQRAHERLLESQLRGLALVSARSGLDLRVMLPMITTVEETRDVKTALASERDGLALAGGLRPLPVGIMVETPAAVLMAGAFAAEVEFFSIGTNDLTQYVMACDRLNAGVASLLHPLQPAVLRAIATLVSAARPAKRHVGVCGEMASDPRMALLLVGLGVDDLSMNPASIPAVKATLAAYSLDEARAIAEQALDAITLAEVETVVTAIRVEEP